MSYQYRIIGPKYTCANSATSSAPAWQSRVDSHMIIESCTGKPSFGWGARLLFCASELVLLLLNLSEEYGNVCLICNMYAPGYGYPFHGARNGAPGNAAAGGPPAGAAAAAGQQNHNNNAADPNGNNANNNNANGYVFNPTWGAAQQAAWAAQFGGAYVPGYGAGVPAGGGGIGGMGGGLFGGNAANNNNNMGGVGAAGGVGPIPPNFGATYGVGL